MKMNLKQSFIFQLIIQSIPLVLLLFFVFKGQGSFGILASFLSFFLIKIIFKKYFNERFTVNKKHVLSLVILCWMVVLVGSIIYIYLDSNNKDLLEVMRDAWIYYIKPVIYIFGFLMGIPFILYLIFRSKELKDKKK